jgi:hypothetical protein
MSPKKSKLNTNIEENVKLKSTKKTTDSTSNEIVTIDEPHVEVPSKKRGRKPKGGKVLQLVSNETLSTNVVPNIILHLKCNMQDIKDNVFSPDDIASFNSTENNYDTYHNTISNEPSIVKNVENENNNSDHDDDESSSIKDVMKLVLQEGLAVFGILANLIHLQSTCLKASPILMDM